MSVPLNNKIHSKQNAANNIQDSAQSVSIDEITKNQSLESFCTVLASKRPTPGGGSVAAVQGALGCGLIAMVADLTIGKGKYSQYQDLNIDILDKSRKLQELFLEIIDADIAAYSQMLGVMRLPKDTDEQATYRTQEIQRVLKECAVPPFEILQNAAQAIEYANQLIGKSNAMAQSDLGCAATNLKSAMQNAWLNVTANTSYIKDVDFAKSYEADAQNLLNKYSQIADDIYNKCL